MRIQVLFLTLLGLLMSVTAHPQIVTNGDFETGDLDGWTVSDGTISEQGDAISGDYSFIKLWGNSDLLISQAVEVEPGKEYTLSFDTDRSWDFIYVVAKVYDAIADTLIEEGSAHLLEEPEGRVDFVAPEGGTVRIDFSKTADEPGKIWIDNIEIAEKTDEPEPTESILVNGDFETGDFTGWENHADNGLVQSADDYDPETAVGVIDGTYSYFKNWGGGLMITQVVEVEPGKEYTLSYSSHLAWDWIYVYGRVFDTSNDEKIAETYVHKKDTAQASVDFIAPESGSVEISFDKWADSPGRIAIDNVVLQEKVSTSVPVTANDFSGHINLYPNPSNGVLNLIVSEDLVGATYHVFNILGSRVSTGTVSANHQLLDFTQYESGIYIFRLKANGRNISKKISIQ